MVKYPDERDGDELALENTVHSYAQVSEGLYHCLSSPSSALTVGETGAQSVTLRRHEVAEEEKRTEPSDPAHLSEKGNGKSASEKGNGISGGSFFTGLLRRRGVVTGTVPKRKLTDEWKDALGVRLDRREFSSLFGPIGCATYCTLICCLLNIVGLFFFSTNKCLSDKTIMSSSTRANAHSSTSMTKTFETSPQTVTLVFCTGRSASKHMANLFPSIPGRVYVTHQEEDAEIATRDFVHRHYRSLASAETEADFNASARAFVADVKLPHIAATLRRSDAARFVYTGHLPLAFGLGPALLDALPVGTLRIVRLRRDRIATATSLMALGPESEDPWGSAETRKRRWFPAPRSAMARLRVEEDALAKLNRFQKWLWYVDDVECRWQALLRDRGEMFEWIEESLEGLEVMDGGRGWARVGAFMGVKVDGARLGMRDNSIRDKGRRKAKVDEGQLQKWDMEYRKLVGVCDLSGDQRRDVSWAGV